MIEKAENINVYVKNHIKNWNYSFNTLKKNITKEMSTAVKKSAIFWNKNQVKIKKLKKLVARKKVTHVRKSKSNSIPPDGISPSQTPKISHTTVHYGKGIF